MKIRTSSPARWLLTVFASIAVFSSAGANAATFVVTSLADTAGASCAANCTLRQAITAANATAAADTINFAVATPTLGELMIQPALLPTITQPVLIDGYSQSGTQLNTDPVATNATVRIRIDGNNGSVTKGLSICADDVTIRGLSITGFAVAGIGYGLQAGGGTCASSHTGGLIIGNFIGMRANGVTAVPNVVGIEISGAVVEVGSEADADRNIVASNETTGIRIVRSGSSGGGVYNNLIGTDRSGVTDHGNGAHGIEISAAAGNIDIGTNTARNLIAFNGVGIQVTSTAAGDSTFFANELRRNDGLGVDLGSDGVTANDTDDADTGTNGLQNFPEILSGVRTGTGGTTVGMRLDVGHAGTRVYRIGLYASPVCDLSGHGEGEFLLAQILRTISSSTETFSFSSLPGPPLPPGTVLTATATDPDGNTSEFSECFELDPPSLVVNTEIDVGDGICDPFACTLREAIDGANARPAGSFSEITFAIPGAGPHLIAPETPLPALRRSIRIDGYSQPGATPNTLAFGSDAVLRIEIADLDFPRIEGLLICAPDVTLRGLSISGFDANLRTGSGLCVESPLRLTVEGNFFGVRPDGSENISGEANITLAAAATGTRIGGTAPAQRNIIASSTVGTLSASGIAIASATVSDVEILGNYIGTDPSGLLPRGNGGGGIAVSDGAQDIVIGGDAPGAANRIAFNLGDGILVEDTGTLRVTAFGNDIFDNQDSFVGDDLGIRLGAGNGLNDVNDADTGPNLQQNFPVLSAATEGPSGLSVSGSLDVPPSTSNANFRIAIYESSVCDESGRGEGEIFLGAETVVLSGNAETFEFTLQVPPQFEGDVITATATDPVGNTSAFSVCLTAPVDPFIFGDGFED